jgi:hypothetical protein
VIANGYGVAGVLGGTLIVLVWRYACQPFYVVDAVTLCNRWGRPKGAYFEVAAAAFRMDIDMPVKDLLKR